MSSRSKKKRLWREEKERRYQVEKEFYDKVIGNLEQMKKDYEEGKLIARNGVPVYENDIQ